MTFAESASGSENNAWIKTTKTKKNKRKLNNSKHVSIDYATTSRRHYTFQMRTINNLLHQVFSMQPKIFGDADIPKSEHPKPFSVCETVNEKRNLDEAKATLKDMLCFKDLNYFLDINKMLELLQVFNKIVLDFSFPDNFSFPEKFPSEPKISMDTVKALYYSIANEHILEVFKSIFLFLFFYWPEQKAAVFENFMANYIDIFEVLCIDALTEATKFYYHGLSLKKYYTFPESKLFISKVMEVVININVCVSKISVVSPYETKVELSNSQLTTFYKAVDYMDRLQGIIAIKPWICYNLPIKWFFEFSRLYAIIQKANSVTKNQIFSESFISRLLKFVNLFLTEINTKSYKPINPATVRLLHEQYISFGLDPFNINKDYVAEMQECGIKDVDNEINEHPEDPIETPLDDLISNYQKLKRSQNSSRADLSKLKNQENKINMNDSAVEDFEKKVIPHGVLPESENKNEILNTNNQNNTITMKHESDGGSVEVISIQNFKKMRRLSLNLLYEMFPLLNAILIKTTAIENYWNIDKTIIALKMETETEISEGKIATNSNLNIIEKEICLSFEQCVECFVLKFPGFSKGDVESILIQNDYEFEKTLEILTKVSEGDLDALLPYCEDDSNKQTKIIDGYCFDDFVDEIKDYELSTGKPISIDDICTNDFEKLAELQQKNCDASVLLQSLFLSLEKDQILNGLQSQSLDELFVELVLRSQYPKLYNIIDEEIEVEEEVISTSTVEEELEIPVNLDEIAAWKDMFPQLSYLTLKKNLFKANGNSEAMLKHLEDHLKSLEAAAGPFQPGNSKNLAKDDFEKLKKNKKELLHTVESLYKGSLFPSMATFFREIDNKQLETPELYNALKDKINIMKCFGGLTIQFSEYCLEVNGYHTGIALIYAVTNYKTCTKSLRKFYGLKKQNKKPKKPKLAFCKLAQTEKGHSLDDFIRPSFVPFSRKTITAAKMRSFLLIIDSIPFLRNVRTEFSKLLFLYFNGNEKRAMAFLLLFNNMKSIVLINQAAEGLEDPFLFKPTAPVKEPEDFIDIPLKEIVVKEIPTSKIIKTKKVVRKRIPIVREFKYSSSEKKRKAEQMLSDLLVDYTVDLTTFEPLEAIYVVAKAANLWWKAELEQRKSYCIDEDELKQRGATSLQHLGIAIHSRKDESDEDEGLKKEKQCKNYLQCNGYLLLERDHMIFIVGKTEI